MGILMIYDDSEIEIITDVMFNLRDNEIIMEIVKANYTIYFAHNKSKEVKDILSKYNLTTISPVVLFMHDPDFKFLENNKLIIDKIEGFIEYTFLCEKITDNSSKITKRPHKQIKNTSSGQNYSNNNQFDDDSKLSSVQLIEKQKRELEEMENEVRKREMEKKMAEQKKYEQEEILRKKLSHERRTKEDCKKRLLPEPSESDPNVSVIKFRLPNGSIVERKFLKQWRVEQLYYYIGSMDDVLLEEDSSFDLIQNFPKKEYTDQDKTLEEEGLFPKVSIQVREK